MMETLLFVLFIISSIIVFYLAVFIIVDTFFEELEHERDEKQK